MKHCSPSLRAGDVLAAPNRPLWHSGMDLRTWERALWLEVMATSPGPRRHLPEEACRNIILVVVSGSAGPQILQGGHHATQSIPSRPQDHGGDPALPPTATSVTTPVRQHQKPMSGRLDSDREAVTTLAGMMRRMESQSKEVQRGKSEDTPGSPTEPGHFPSSERDEGKAKEKG